MSRVYYLYFTVVASLCLHEVEEVRTSGRSVLQQLFLYPQVAPHWHPLPAQQLFYEVSHDQSQQCPYWCLPRGPSILWRQLLHRGCIFLKVWIHTSWHFSTSTVAKREHSGSGSYLQVYLRSKCCCSLTWGDPVAECWAECCRNNPILYSSCRLECLGLQRIIQNINQQRSQNLPPTKPRTLPAKFSRRRAPLIRIL